MAAWCSGLLLKVVLWAVLALPMVSALTLEARASASDATSVFYDPEQVQTIHLRVQPEDLTQLRRALPKRITVPGTFEWNDRQIQRVGIRYKGNSSSAPESPHKRSFLVAFSEYLDDQRFLGLRHVALDNGIQFGSLFSERLITDTLRSVGVKASRCNYARVFLNGDYLGVFVNVERIDKSFLERYFASSAGPLFKVDEGGPGAELNYFSDEPAAYEQTFELHSGKKKASYPQLRDFVKAVNAGDDLSQILDVEAFLKTTAVLLLAGAFDQYTGWGPHNFYLYRDPSHQRWTYLPWDLDVGFADHAFGRVPVLQGWHAAWPAPLPGRPLMERLVTNPELLRQYRALADSILEAHFRPEIIVPRLRALHAQIREDLDREPFPARRATNPGDTDYQSIVDSMEQFMRQRYALARAQLNNPGPRPQPARVENVPGGEGPTPGPASADAPSELHATEVSPSRVVLAWKDNARGEAAFVVQRSDGAESERFVNAIGQPGEDITTATDRAVQPGGTYRYRVYAVLPTPQGPRGTGPSNVITVTIPSR